MIFYSEPDEGTIMIWIDELVEELKKYDFEEQDEDDINSNIDDDGELKGIRFMYFIDADYKEYNEIVEIVKRHNYKILGWEAYYLNKSN